MADKYFRVVEVLRKCRPHSWGGRNNAGYSLLEILLTTLISGLMVVYGYQGVMKILSGRLIDSEAFWLWKVVAWSDERFKSVGSYAQLDTNHVINNGGVAVARIKSSGAERYIQTGMGGRLIIGKESGALGRAAVFAYTDIAKSKCPDFVDALMTSGVASSVLIKTSVDKGGALPNISVGADLSITSTDAMVVYDAKSGDVGIEPLKLGEFCFGSPADAFATVTVVKLWSGAK